MEKTEEKKLLSMKISNWIVNNRKKMWGITFAIYGIIVIIFAILTIIANGGLQESLYLLNDYPEQEYQELEEILRDIVVECDGIYPEKLPNDSIKYDVSYKEHSNFEGKYTITLTDDVTITGTIGKDFKKENLIIEREYETESEYRRQQYVSTILGNTLIPVLAVCCIYLLLDFIFLLIIIIESLVKWYRKKTKK